MTTLPRLHPPGGAVNTQPVAGLHVSVVHGLLSLQTLGVPEQAPPAHVSPVVHGLLSLHAAVLFVKTQPVAGLHVSVVHGLLSLQTLAAPTQVPPAHVSPVVHAFPSLHAAVVFACVHNPLTQASFVHTLLSSQSAVDVQAAERTFIKPGVRGPIVVVLPDFSQSAPECVSLRGNPSKREMLTPSTSPLLGFGPVQVQPAGGGLTEGPVSKAT